LKINQHTFADLEASLRFLSQVYTARPNNMGDALQRECRAVVIRAKDRARFASRNTGVSEIKRRIKAEMVEWMLVWLGDPALFEAWVTLRRQHMDPDLLTPEIMNQEPMSEERVKCNVCGGSGQCTVCKGTSNGGQCFNCAGTGNCPQCQGSGRRPLK
jgi:hypothetical protein